MTYIDMDQDGLQDDIARPIAGESIVVDTDSFRNDMERLQISGADSKELCQRGL